MAISYLHAILLYGPIALLGNFIAWKRGFFHFSGKPRPLPTIHFGQLICAFIIYPFSYLFFLHLLSAITPLKELGTAIKILEYLIPLTLLYLFFQAVPIRNGQRVWTCKSSKEIKHDLGIGAMTWLIAFPLVVTIAYLSDYLILSFVGATDYEQNAVSFVKSSVSSFPALLTALAAVLFFAPLLEEFLFRGLLQNWLRKYLRPVPAILVTSLGFACFHFSFAQGWGNITLIASLFTFGCYLGFLYEKERSLFAPIALHYTFNLVTTFRILLSTQE